MPAPLARSFNPRCFCMNSPTLHNSISSPSQMCRTTCIANGSSNARSFPSTCADPPRVNLVVLIVSDPIGTGNANLGLRALPCVSTATPCSMLSSECTPPPYRGWKDRSNLRGFSCTRYAPAFSNRSSRAFAARVLCRIASAEYLVKENWRLWLDPTSFGAEHIRCSWVA